MIGDLLPHRLAPTLMAMGVEEYPASVSCMGGNLAETDRGPGPDGKPYGERRDVGDTHLVTVQFPSGVMLFVASSTANERGVEDLIRGQKANLLMGGGKLVLEPERPFSDEVERKEEDFPESKEVHAQHVRNFFDALRGNGTPPLPDRGRRAHPGHRVHGREVVPRAPPGPLRHRGAEDDRVSAVALGLEAMATRFELLLAGDDPARLRAAGEEALREIERVEGLLSRYRPSTAIAAINAAAGGEPVRVDPRVLALLRRCAELTRLTDGAFDITIGPLLRAWGFVGGSGRAADPEALARARDLVGMEWVELDAATSTVRLARAGMELDLGAVGKGYAIDCAIAVLEEHGVPRGLLHGGTSSVHVIGHVSARKPWRVAWRAPGEADRLRTLTAAQPALSVSAPHGKAFVLDGRLMGHVLDPKTGEPAGQALSACVVGPSSTVCDALSTALLVNGSRGCAWLAQRFPGYRGWVAGAARGRRAAKIGARPDAVLAR